MQTTVTPPRPIKEFMAMTAKEIKNKKRKLAREITKKIEKLLHPCLKIGGIDIIHRHTGRYIYFSAWKGDDPVNQKEVRYYRDDILSNKGIPLDDVLWLIEKSRSDHEHQLDKRSLLEKH